MRQRSIIISAHIAGWLLFFSLVIGFLFRQSDGEGILKNILSFAFIQFCTVYLFIFYFNSYVLVPRLYLKKKQLLYALSILLIFISIFLLSPYETLIRMGDRPGRQPQEQLQHREPPGPPPHDRRLIHVDITSIILFVACMSVSTALCIAKQWRTTEQRAIRAEADKANAELSFLKTQISPHFLFNTLNNLYALAITKNDNTAPGIMKLSNIMRYLTDEVQEDFVALKSEIDCIQDYVDLQSLRLGKNTKVRFDIWGELNNKKIGPLILLTFIENAFKHGVSNHEPSEIIIRLLAEEQSIKFICWNKLFASKKNTERTGIGMANVKQRLQYLYPDRHSLTIKTEDGFYIVNLTLQF